MQYCEHCGRQLEDGQVCNCIANQNLNKRGQPSPLYNQNVYANGINMIDPNAPKKKSNVGIVILAIAIPIVLVVLIVCGILAAILVPAMIGYTQKSKLAAQNSASNSICKAINSALTEMDDEGYNVGGNYFICSDVSSSFCFDFNGSDLDYGDLNDRINEFTTDAANSKWFAVCENGVATYVSSAESWDSEIVGTYPSLSTLDTQKGYERTYSDKQELEDIFNDTLEDLNYYY